jgi:hypothetical protein
LKSFITNLTTKPKIVSQIIVQRIIQTGQDNKLPAVSSDQPASSSIAPVKLILTKINK